MAEVTVEARELARLRAEHLTANLDEQRRKWAIEVLADSEQRAAEGLEAAQNLSRAERELRTERETLREKLERSESTNKRTVELLDIARSSYDVLRKDHENLQNEVERLREFKSAAEREIDRLKDERDALREKLSAAAVKDARKSKGAQ